MGDFYDIDGRPLDDVLEWARSGVMNDPRRSFRRDAARPGVPELGEVSTVFLAMDHGFGFGPPVLYETLVFGSPLADEMERYVTKAQAEAGHWEMLERLRAVPLYRLLWQLVKDTVREAAEPSMRERMDELSRVALS